MIFLKRFKRFITSWNNDSNNNIYLRGKFFNDSHMGDSVSISKSQNKLHYSFRMIRRNRLYEIFADISVCYGGDYISVRFYHPTPGRMRKILRIEDYKIDNDIYRDVRYDNTHVYVLMGGVNYADTRNMQRSMLVATCSLVSLFDKNQSKLSF